MGNVVQFYGDSFTDVDIGAVTGSATALRFPSVPAKLARFKAKASNIGSFFLGQDIGDNHFELDANDDTGWFSISNLNQYSYQNPSGTSDTLAYWILD